MNSYIFILIQAMPRIFHKFWPKVTQNSWIEIYYVFTKMLSILFADVIERKFIDEYENILNRFGTLVITRLDHNATHKFHALRMYYGLIILNLLCFNFLK